MLHYIDLINEDQNLVYVFIRAILLLVIGTLLIRFGDRRFKLNNSFDLLIIVIFGGLISRGINGPATLLSTIIGLIALILTHKILAICTRKSLLFEHLFKGKRYLLIKNGHLQKSVLRNLNITQKDIEEQMRQQINTSSLDNVLFAYLERTGHISFIIKD
ncbi:DUF421 domain-containing protein [Legionella parisiensis]|uniref:YetF C-terminal domain-containing protein n=1 Tax=Legionella parisiensis TaxID=45071 RepID=A0A1E5JQ67_9GAMM|nr:YetF domain-containing protein [Legionella parisiensis]KTD39893.1 hypothetical protein Lpar_1210 [Legionella parisiensis]OEH46674.1 hypothetical protein lpari_02345 [Legionella parisiensis]STX77564.1 Protein of uncharacterised function (DUF421) [Legionella parisiensis]